MADRFPLIANSSSNQIQELASADNLDLTGNNIVGAVNVTASGSLNVTGVSTFGGNLTVGGVLTYEDVPNIDSLGIVTARTGIKVLAGGANIVGVTTAASGLVVSSGGISIVGGGATVAGIATFHDGADIEGFKVEDGQTAATPNGEFTARVAVTTSLTSILSFRLIDALCLKFG